MSRNTQIFILFLICIHARAQHYNDFLQYMFNGFLINPAYAGSHEALELSGNYRKQWMGFNGAPQTVAFGAHTPMRNKANNLGLLVTNDQFGIFTHQKFALAYAYRFRIKNSFLSLGLQGGADYLSSNWSKLNTIQENDPNFSVGQQRTVIPVAGFGAYFHSQKIYFGISVPELYYGGYSNYHSVLTNGGCIIKMSDNFLFKPAFLIKYMQGSPLAANLSGTFYWKEIIGLGAGYTYMTSAMAFLDLRINDQMRVSYGYDYSLNALSNYSSGSHELMLRYLLRYKVEAVNTRYF
jgi:type IX secretion system PorP/SprF family membrane protein